MTIFDKAEKFCKKKHKGQKYNNGPFWKHPFLTAAIIAVVAPLDDNLWVAAILHDTLEDTETTYEELKEEFGSDVADLVKEVTKSGYNKFPNLKTQRGVILKFADRLSNISSIDFLGPEKAHKYIFEKSKFWET
jgi:(p)ppGpp synthase/HD superfamily hydrolase